MNLISVWLSNCIHLEVWDEITYPFPNVPNPFPQKFVNG